MNIQVDTLEYATALEKAGIERAHAEAIAKLQARTVKDLVDHELVTKDFLKSELAVTKSELRSELAGLKSEFSTDLAGLKSEFSSDLAGVKSELRDEIRSQTNRLELQIRALQYGAAIAAFAVSVVVVLSRLIK